MPTTTFNPNGPAYTGDEPAIAPRAAWYLHCVLGTWHDTYREDPGAWVNGYCPPIAERVWGKGNTPQAKRVVESIGVLADRLATGEWDPGYLAHNMAEQIIVGQANRAVGELFDEDMLVAPEDCGIVVPPADPDEWESGMLDHILLLDVDHEYLYNAAMDGIDQIAADPDSDLGIGDFLHPDKWWDTFGGVDDEVDWTAAGRSTALELRMNTLIADGLAAHPNSGAWRSTLSMAAFMAGLRAAELGLTSKDDEEGTLFIKGFFEGLGS